MRFTTTVLSALLLNAAALTPMTSNAQISPAGKNVRELQRRLSVCLEAEEWLRAPCLEAVRPANPIKQLRSETSTPRPTPSSVPMDKPETPSVAPTPAPVSDELHVIGIYEPLIRRGADGEIRSGEVTVFVDRPGRTVTLVLAAYERVGWVVSTTPDTKVERIILGGHGARDSRVTLMGEEFEAEIADTNLAYKDEGSTFQLFIEAATKAAGNERAASFDGSYRAPAQGFTITAAPGVKTRAEKAAELARDSVAISDLPAELRASLEAAGHGWCFGEKGFTGTGPDGARVTYEVPVDMPDISAPSGVAYDPDTRRIWGVTYGGEGFLFNYDIDADTWSAKSMNNFDAGGLIYDPTNDRLLATPGMTGWGFLVVTGDGKIISGPDIEEDDFPGFKDLYDPGNEPSPSLVPVAIADGKLLVRVDDRFGRDSSNSPLYLVDLDAGSVRLVR